MKRTTYLATFAGAVLVAALAWAQWAPSTIYFEPGGGRMVIQSGASADVQSGGEIDIESGGRLEFAGTAITSTAAELNILDGVTSTAAELNILDGVTSTATELNILDGVTATTAELNEYAVQVRLADISSAQSTWVVAPHAGNITKVYTVIDAAVSVGDAVITLEIGGTLVTDSSITIAQSGSAAGDVDSSTPSAANAVTAGQAIEVITDGGSTGMSEATVTIVITR